MTQLADGIVDGSVDGSESVPEPDTELGGNAVQMAIALLAEERGGPEDP